MNRGRMSFGLWLVLVGVLVLLSNLGWLDRTFWGALVEMWPLLLVLFGLHLVLSRTIFWPLPVLAGVAVAGAVFFFGADIPFLPWSNEQVVKEFTYTLEPETERLDIRLDVGAIDLVLKRGEPGGISGRLASSHEPVVTHVTTNNRARVVLDQSRGPRVWTTFLDRLGRWEVLVPPDVPVGLDLKGGAGSFDLDFRGLDVQSIVLRGGAARFELHFDDVGTHTTVEADTGVADVRINVPVGVGLRVTTTGGLTNHNLASAGLERTNGAWQTPGYEQSERTIVINATSGLGNFRVTRD